MAINQLDEQLIDLQTRLKAKQKRILFLEKLLAQKTEDTQKDYPSRIQGFESMQKNIMQLFLEASPSMCRSHLEIEREFRFAFLGLPKTNLPRRTRELVLRGFLWACSDKRAVVVFGLKMVEQKVKTLGDA